MEYLQVGLTQGHYKIGEGEGEEGDEGEGVRSKCCAASWHSFFSLYLYLNSLMFDVVTAFNPRRIV
jgi:hypothetical protein